MDINDSATRENLFKLIACQLVITSATRNNHCLDIQVIERVGHAMEKHAVVRDDLVCFIKITRTSLRITTAQITWRQNRLNTSVPQHGLRCQTYLREQSFGSTTREIEHCFCINRSCLWISDDRHHIRIFNIQ